MRGSGVAAEGSPKRSLILEIAIPSSVSIR